MKKIISVSVLLVVLITALVSFTSCFKNSEESDLWKDAVYLEDTTLGEGSKTLIFEVEVDEKKIIFTIKTDKDTVGEALIEHNLIEGEDGAYGLYVKKVNGITADYDVDQTYWAFYVDGEYAMSGVELTEINEESVYKFARAK